MNKKKLQESISKIGFAVYELKIALYKKKVISSPDADWRPTHGDYPISLKTLEIGIHDLNTKFNLLLGHLGLEYDELPARAVIQKRGRGP